MECREVKNMLSEYIDGVLPGNLSPVVKQHLSACSECRDTYYSMGRLVDLMQEMDPIAEPADFRANVQARLETGPSLWKRARLLVAPVRVKVPLGIAAALVVAVMIFVLPGPDRPEKSSLKTVVTDGAWDASVTDATEPLATDKDTNPPGSAREQSHFGDSFVEGDVDKHKDKATDVAQPPVTWGGVTEPVARADRVVVPGEKLENPVAEEGLAAGKPANKTPTRGGRQGETFVKLSPTAVVNVSEDAETEAITEDLASNDYSEMTVLEHKADSPAVDELLSAAPDRQSDPVTLIELTGGSVIGTELDDSGERIALIASIPADSMQAIIRRFGEDNVTLADQIMDTPGPPVSGFLRAKKRVASVSAEKAESPDSAPSSGPIYVRIRIKH